MARDTCPRSLSNAMDSTNHEPSDPRERHRRPILHVWEANTDPGRASLSVVVDGSREPDLALFQPYSTPATPKLLSALIERTRGAQ
jgi:hypothetical protein